MDEPDEVDPAVVGGLRHFGVRDYALICYGDGPLTRFSPRDAENLYRMLSASARAAWTIDDWMEGFGRAIAKQAGERNHQL